MGVDTKSGPAIHGQLAENGYEDIASAISPSWKCNAPAEIRGSLKIEMPDGTDQSALRISGSGGVPDTTPALNPRGPSGFEGHQFPVAGEPYITLPGGGGSGTNYGSNIGIAQSPQFGSPDLGDFSVNSSGGFDVSPSMGGQPPSSLSAGAMNDGEGREFKFDPPIEVGGGGGGLEPGEGDGGGGDGGGGDDGIDGLDPDLCDIANMVCDMMLEGNLCVNGEIADKDGVTNSVRWGKVVDGVGKNTTGYVQLEGTPAEAKDGEENGGLTLQELLDAPALGPDEEDAGNGANGANNAINAEDKDKDKPACPREGPDRPNRPEAEGDPGAGDGGDGTSGEAGGDPSDNAVIPREDYTPVRGGGTRSSPEVGQGTGHGGESEGGSVTFTVGRDSTEFV